MSKFDELCQKNAKFFILALAVLGPGFLYFGIQKPLAEACSPDNKVIFSKIPGGGYNCAYYGNDETEFKEINKQVAAVVDRFPLILVNVQKMNPTVTPKQAKL